MWQKFKRKIRAKFIASVKNTWFQFRAYPSYWHSVLYRTNLNTSVRPTHFLYIEPNPGAGIGHQLSNWNSALYFAGHFGLNFAHSPFSTPSWERFLGFGVGVVTAKQLITDGYEKVQLPKFDSADSRQLRMIKAIIDSYSKQNVLFRLELDQGFLPQFPTAGILREKFFNAPSRANDKLIYSSADFNIAVHIRRGDIVTMKSNNRSEWELRWMDDSYYLNVLKEVLPIVEKLKKTKVYIFSQGKMEDYPELRQFDNFVFCLDMNAINSFLHMVNADLLISSKSSFSYKPALISEKIKIVPKTFWHQYPPTADFILTDNEGYFDKKQLIKQLNGNEPDL
jgi:hypothetical protein